MSSMLMKLLALLINSHRVEGVFLANLVINGLLICVLSSRVAKMICSSRSSFVSHCLFHQVR